MNKLKPVTEADLEGKRVLVRVDWNVLSPEGEVADDFRVRRSLRTLEYIRERASKLIVATHLSPDGASAEPLKKFLPEGAELLENLRNSPGEKNNDPDFAKFLAGKADIFVNEAFSASHRKHASIVGIPEFLPSYAGLTFMEEVGNLSKAFNPSHPFLLILGGVKPATKLPLVRKFLGTADSVFIGGLLAAEAHEEYKGDPKVIFPSGDIKALDIDEETLENLKFVIHNSKFILWNGPLGMYEEGHKEGTLALAKILADSGKEVIVGGGDTLAAIKELDLLDKFTFASTGGGAMLDFLANRTLPGIEALVASRN